MSSVTTQVNVPVEALSREEGRAMLDDRAQHYLGISGDEFIRKWSSGEFNNGAEQPDVIRLAMLLPFAIGSPTTNGRR